MTAVAVRRSRNALYKGGGYWTITFDGQDAPKKHEKALLYVAWLLTHPPKESIHAIDLVAKIPDIYRQQLGLTSIVDEATGKAVSLHATAMPQERSHAPDDLEVARRIRAKEQEWEAVLGDENTNEPEKAEALRKLEELASFQRQHAMSSKSNAEKLVRAVRLAITRLHENLAAATDGNGQPHPVFRRFADHLAMHLIAPSARFNGRMGADPCRRRRSLHLRTARGRPMERMTDEGPHPIRSPAFIPSTGKALSQFGEDSFRNNSGSSQTSDDVLKIWPWLTGSQRRSDLKSWPPSVPPETGPPS